MASRDSEERWRNIDMIDCEEEKYRLFEILDKKEEQDRIGIIGSGLPSYRQREREKMVFTPPFMSSNDFEIGLASSSEIKTNSDALENQLPTTNYHNTKTVEMMPMKSDVATQWNSQLQQSDLSTANKFICYSRTSALAVQFDGVFYIQADPGVPLEPPSKFFIKVQSPSGAPCEYQICRDPQMKNRYCCKFPAPQPGMYSIEVRYEPSKVHIRGSEFQIVISRDYGQSSQDFQPIVNYAFLHPPKLLKTWGIAANRVNDYLYVPDRDFGHILMLRPDGSVIKTFGRSGNRAGEFFRPTGVACDQFNNRLIITDKDNHRIVFYTLNGEFISQFGKKGNHDGLFNYPWDVCVSPDGSKIAVTDSRNHRVQLFDKFGKFLSKYSVFETNPFVYKQTFDYPRGITFSRDGTNVYVTDFNTSKFLELNGDDLTFSRNLAFNVLQRPQGLDIDNVGNFLICNRKDNCLKVLDNYGNHISTLKNTGPAANFYSPTDIAVLSNGKVALVDNNSRVRIF